MVRGSQLPRAGAGEVGIPGPQGGLLLEAGGQCFKAVSWQEIEPSVHHPQPELQDPPPEKRVGCWQPLLRVLSLCSRESLRIRGKSGLSPGKTQKPFPFCTQFQELPGPSDLSPPVPSLRLETCRATPQPWAARLRAGHIPAGHRGRQPSHGKLVRTVPGLALEKETLPGVLGGGGRSQTPSIFLVVMGTLPSCPKRGSPRTSPVISGFVST